MTESYMNRFLYVDLTNQQISKLDVPGWLKENYIGGKGFGARLLYDLLKKNTDPLGPGNILMFMTGPLTSTSAPAMRAAVICKSPLTGGYLDSYFGGHFGPEIKYAGYDGIIIHGKSSVPVYLSIHDDDVSFCDASDIWGKDSLKSNAAIKDELNDDTFKVATIGQAGEHQVLFSLINCEYNRQAGRGGAGAVMGAKNLKGIAVKGTRLVRIHNPASFQTIVKKALKEISSSEACNALTESGTSYAVKWSSDIGTLPVKNFKSQHDDNADAIGDKGQRKHLFLGKSACFGCPIRCSQMGVVRSGRHAHLITDTVEYESAAMLGSNLAIHDIKKVTYLTRCCDEYGVDTISVGNIIGFVFEAVEKGIIEPPDGQQLTFGSASGAEYLIHAICQQKTELGKILGQGVKKAAQVFGQNSKDFALHVKGLEMPGWAPRGTPGMGLAYMTADRGACHQRGFMVGYEAGGELYDGQPVSQYGIENKAFILKNEQDYLSGTDTLVKCDFAAFGVFPETYAAMLEAATGEKTEIERLKETGERIWTLIRMFNLREGIKPKDDRLPKRIVNEPLADGKHKGHLLDKELMGRLLKEYYQVRGWGSDGIPEKDTLDRLGIKTETLFKI